MTTPIAQYQGVIIASGPQPWQVLQRATDGNASVTLTGAWKNDAPSVVEVRVASEDTQGPAAGCDWQKAEMLAEQQWQITLRIPTGGLYRIETRLHQCDAEWRLTGDKIWHIAVGDLWVIAGQSNAVGYGHGLVHDPPQLGVALFGGDEQWRLATHPIFDPTNTKHPANRDGGWVDISPWLAFAKAIYTATHVPIGLIPTALGGSPMDAWDPGHENPYLYQNMLAHIAAAGGRVAGMTWYQGESDCSLELAPTYVRRFSRMVEDFRQRFGAETPVVTVQLNRHLFDGDDHSQRSWTMLREAQCQAARLLPRVAVIPSLDLTLADGIHISGVGNIALGERCALTALGMAYHPDIQWHAAEVRDANFSNTERTEVHLRFAHVIDHLLFLAQRPADYVVEDNDGLIPSSNTYVDGTDCVVLTLTRPAGAGAVVHGNYGINPPSTLRDHLHRPVLGFYGLAITEESQLQS